MIKKTICVSDAVYQHHKNLFDNSQRLTVIHDAVDIQKFTHIPINRAHFRKQWGLKDNELLVGNIAHLNSSKDHVTFLRVARLLRKRKGLNVKFMIVGTGALLSSLQNLARRLHITQDTIFTGFRHDIPHLLNHFDCLLISSRHEGCSSVCLEGMAARVPIVATAVGGIPELLQHNFSAFIAPPGDVERLADYVATTLLNPKNSQHFTLKAFERAQQHFNIESIAQKTLTVYRDVLKTDIDQVGNF